MVLLHLVSGNHCQSWDQLYATALPLQVVSNFLYMFTQCRMPVLHQRRMMETLVSVLRDINPELAQSMSTADPTALLGMLLADLECVAVKCKYVICAKETCNRLRRTTDSVDLKGSEFCACGLAWDLSKCIYTLPLAQHQRMLMSAPAVAKMMRFSQDRPEPEEGEHLASLLLA